MATEGAKFLLVGDLHLDKLTSKFGQDKGLHLQINEITKPLIYAKKHHIKHVIFVGDIADKPQLSQKALISLVRLIHQYTNNGTITFHFLLGNHDKEHKDYYSLQPLQDLIDIGLLNSKFVKVYANKPELVKLDGVPVCFCPFPHNVNTVDKGPAYYIGHHEVNGSTRDNGTKVKSKFEEKSKHKYPCGLGHLHTPHDVGKYHFVGTLYQLSFGEAVDKYFTVVDATYNKKKGKVVANYLRVKNDQRFKFINLDIESPSDLKKLSSDEFILYKIFCKKGVEIPKDLTYKYPNIVGVIGYSSKKELKELINPVITLQELDIRSNLESVLKDRHDLSDLDIERAHSLLTRIGIDDTRKKVKKKCKK